MQSDREVLELAFIAVENYEEPIQIGYLANNAYFIEDLPNNFEEASADLFLLNVTEPRASRLTDLWVEKTNEKLHYWASYENWDRAIAFIGTCAELSISEVRFNDEWIKLILVPGGTDVIHRKSFCEGLSALEYALMKRHPIQFSPTLAAPSLRSILVQRLVPFAKPIKRFIPNRLVVFLYKILEKLR